MPSDGIPETTQTLVDALHGPDCPARQQRVAALVQVYQPVLRKVVAAFLHKKCPGNFREEDLEDIVGNEIAIMLNPDEGYFSTYELRRGRLRHWIKQGIRNRTLDFLRKYARTSHEEIEEPLLGKEIDRMIDEQEAFTVLRIAIDIAENRFRHNDDADTFECFLAVKSRKHGMSPGERRERWSEWEERVKRIKVRDLIRDDAIPSAARQICDHPEDMTELLQELWDGLQNKRAIDLPL